MRSALSVDRLSVVGLVLGAALIGATASAVDSWADWPLFAPVLATGALSLATVIYLHRTSHDAFSPLGLVCLFYFATFSLGAAYRGTVEDVPDRFTFDLDGMITAAWLGLLGLSALIVGYATNMFGVVRSILPRLPREPASGMTGVLVVLGIVGWLARLQQIAWHQYFYNEVEQVSGTGASWIIIALATLPLVVIGTVGASYQMARRRGQTARRSQLVYYGFLAIEIAYNAPRGSRAALLTIIMLVVVLRYYGLGRRPSVPTTLALTGVAVFVLFPLLFNLRNQGGSGLRYSDQLSTSASLSVSAFVKQSPAQVLDEGLRATVERFSGATAAAAVASCRCDPPRKPGETLSWTVTSLLPRAIVPSKPNPGNFGNEFGIAYGFANASNQRTAVAQTHVGELYMNFGVPAVALGMLLIGAVYRLLGDVFEGRWSNPLVLGIYAATAWSLVNSQEAIIAASVPGQLKLMGVLVAVAFGTSWLQRMRTIS